MRKQTEYKMVKPKNGECRVINPFAWFPRLIESQWVWLERYEVLQGYFYRAYNVVNEEGERATFSVGQWVNLSERLIIK